MNTIIKIISIFHCIVCNFNCYTEKKRRIIQQFINRSLYFILFFCLLFQFVVVAVGYFYLFSIQLSIFGFFSVGTLKFIIFYICVIFKRKMIVFTFQKKNYLMWSHRMSCSQHQKPILNIVSEFNVARYVFFPR